jgi:hypothetical protein
MQPEPAVRRPQQEQGGRRRAADGDQPAARQADARPSQGGDATDHWCPDRVAAVVGDEVQRHHPAPLPGGRVELEVRVRAREHRRAEQSEGCQQRCVGQVRRGTGSDDSEHAEGAAAGDDQPEPGPSAVGGEQSSGQRTDGQD